MIPRYLVDVTDSRFFKTYCDFLVIGSGIAGLLAGLKTSKQGKVIVLSKGKVNASSSNLAQGGIAAAIAANDSPKSHFLDTLQAGDGLCSLKSVRLVTMEAAESIKELLKLGVPFDTGTNGFLLAREAAHTHARILRCQGDKTGEKIIQTLVEKVKTEKNIQLLENTAAIDIITSRGQCLGAVVMDKNTREKGIIISKATILSTGGIGHIYIKSTNPCEITGDGLSMAFRAGASLMDLEFVQFHPTALYGNTQNAFLISEAVRGEGGILLNHKGERFMEKYHEKKELAPRDIVTRAIYREMEKNNKDFMFLDISHKDRAFLEKRFPTIFSVCLESGIDISQEPIPVAPVAHYHMGGIKIDMNGQTDIAGLFACGESSCSGLHGANRLASNSLLDAVVFANRTAWRASDYVSKMNSVDYKNLYYDGDTSEQIYINENRISTIQEIMSKNVGIIRNGEGLKGALSKIQAFLKDKSSFENFNSVIASYLITYSAVIRKESRGSHFRSDYPEKKRLWKKHIVLKKGERGKILYGFFTG